ncbi:MAG TPA: putative PEP-binding protein [Ilumatobacter sp.]|nr:putative PEP-binding protein [Ilumatobacter sp.]
MTGDLARRIATAVREAAESGTGAAIATAIHSVRPDDLAEFFHASLAEEIDAEPITTGLPASPGAAAGRIVLTAEAAMEAGDRGDAVILVRPETTPDDVLGMQASRGILTARGGMVSHAAVVARGWGIPAVVGAGRIEIDGDAVHVGRTTLYAGDEITIDGSSGKVYLGILDTAGADAPPELETLLAWADAIAAGSVQVRANADTEGDASQGRILGAQGIGLCRTEHMFLAADRLPIMRRFIMARTPEAEEAALAELEDVQTADFETVLEAMDGLPVTVRLLDPPLHEFLPDLVELTARDARGELDESEQVQLGCVRRLREENPMIGTRGVRLGVVRTGVYEMQVRALCQAAANLFARGKRPHVEIMIPLVVEAEELRIARGWVRDVLDEIGHPELKSSVITVGAMIETPRAALTAGELAKHADFFSFGTNDLTQMTYAFSRDDVEAKLLPAYLAAGILPANPFAVLDQQGVGELVRIACKLARAAKPNIKLGACGEHAGHPDSAAFLVGLGLDSLSCSPFRVPLARLGVAQALLASGRVRIGDIEFDLEPAATRVSEQAGDMPDDVHDTQPLDVDEALVLHTLRVRGFVTPDGFRESLGAYPAEILAELVAAGQVRHIEKRDMYGLLPPGKERQEALMESYAGPDVQAGLEPHYERFLELNEVFKQLCTDWQVRGDTQNDHTDASYDADCVNRLTQLCADSHPTIEGFASALPRMARYAPRLDESAAKVAAGETKLFTGVMCGSFHDVWMELHEDLIVLQRINRVEEGSF